MPHHEVVQIDSALTAFLETVSDGVGAPFTSPRVPLVGARCNEVEQARAYQRYLIKTWITENE